MPSDPLTAAPAIRTVSGWPACIFGPDRAASPMADASLDMADRSPASFARTKKRRIRRRAAQADRRAKQVMAEPPSLSVIGARPLADRGGHMAAAPHSRSEHRVRQTLPSLRPDRVREHVARLDCVGMEEATLDRIVGSRFPLQASRPPPGGVVGGLTRRSRRRSRITTDPARHRPACSPQAGSPIGVTDSFRPNDFRTSRTVPRCGCPWRTAPCRGLPGRGPFLSRPWDIPLALATSPRAAAIVAGSPSSNTASRYSAIRSGVVRKSAASQG